MQNYILATFNNAIKNYCIGRLGSIKGIDTLLWRIVETDYARSIGKENLPVAKSLFFKNIYNFGCDFLNNSYNKCI